MSEHVSRDQLIDQFVDDLNELIEAARANNAEQQEAALLALADKYAALLAFLTETQIREFITRDQPPNGTFH